MKEAPHRLRPVAPRPKREPRAGRTGSEPDRISQVCHLKLLDPYEEAFI